MPHEKEITMFETGRNLGGYRPEAYDFLREGLDYAVHKTHGPRARTVRKIVDWLHAHQSDLADLPQLLARGDIPGFLMKFIEEIGGLEEAAEFMNLHVDGEELCWALRDLAQERWGLLAPVVLRHWGIRSTRDFGRMVFTLIEQGMLSKQPHDELSDFDGVYDFKDAFDRCFVIDLSAREQKTEEECAADDEVDEPDEVDDD
ncbi:MAG: hypothetical protein DCC65_04965 [Planctomycetota bacterium]|nr:MAG: hypothetical protein DCC65_04965 [Planctomycetota bacterium]